MIAPFLNVLFNQEKNYELQPWNLSIKVMLNNFNYYLNDYISIHGEVKALALISVMVIVMFFLKNIFRYIGQFFISPVRTGIVRDLRNRMYDKVLRLPLSYFSSERKGDLISRMSNEVW
jgi:ABC-type multidrug transport system fused ATPase/permease subunit